MYFEEFYKSTMWMKFDIYVRVEMQSKYFSHNQKMRNGQSRRMHVKKWLVLVSFFRLDLC